MCAGLQFYTPALTPRKKAGPQNLWASFFTLRIGCPAYLTNLVLPSTTNPSFRNALSQPSVHLQLVHYTCTFTSVLQTFQIPSDGTAVAALPTIQSILSLASTIPIQLPRFRYIHFCRLLGHACLWPDILILKRI